MTDSISLLSSDRVLIVLPHPDDETLATGGLIQHVLAVGAVLRIVVATDGDRNPWPQRWIERRWRIDAEGQRRWGRRRREEARAALNMLGVSETDVCFLGWPDGGLSEALMRDESTCDRLTEEIEAFGPTLVVAPVFNDRHPDHSSLRVIVELAMARSVYAACRRLGYVVHGMPLTNSAMKIPLTTQQQALKERGLEQHHTQMHLSARRLLEIARRPEYFETTSESQLLDRGGAFVELSWPKLQRWRNRYVLFLLIETEARVIRHQVDLPRSGKLVHFVNASPEEAVVTLETNVDGDRLQISLNVPAHVRRIHLKNERTGPRMLIYDADGWHVIAKS